MLCLLDSHRRLGVLWMQFLIMQTCPCNDTPPTPHFYIVKLGLTRGMHYFLIFALKHRLWVLVRTASMVLTCTDNLFLEQKLEKIPRFCIWKLPFLQPWKITVYCMDMFAKCNERPQKCLIRTWAFFIILIRKFNLDPTWYSKTGAYKGIHVFNFVAHYIDWNCLI